MCVGGNAHQLFCARLKGKRSSFRRGGMPQWSTLRILFSVMLLLASKVSCSSLSLSRRTYIVQMSKAAMPATFTSHSSWYESTVVSAKRSESGFIEQEDSSHLLHVYDVVFHGFSARLSPAEANAMETQVGFLRMFPEGIRYLHTTHTPEFLSMNSSSGLLPEASFGEDVIVGVLDTGVWPERESFSDHRLGPVPTRWKGSCDNQPSFNASLCNRKLIGASFFSKGYEASAGPINTTVEFKSPRDGEGHGTHTASTAAGRLVYRASLMGFAEGVARGMAPKSRLAIYKVCWVSGCFDSDILAAFDQAVADGVDIISLSVGGGVAPYYVDPIAIGSYAAVKKGVFVSCSAGNNGPGAFSVTNVAPWIITVAASTVDRNFPANVKLGNGESFQGVSLYSGKGLGPRMLNLIYAANASKYGMDPYSASLCLDGTLDPAKVKGKIVVCDRGTNARVAKGEVVLAAGGAGLILANQAVDGEGLVADAHVLPATAVGAKAGAAIRAYLYYAKNADGTIQFGGTVLGVKPAPVISSFSSRGPNPETPQILKPDITAPGVNILAAWTGHVGPTGLDTDSRRVSFNIISGTSMSCPHISGIGALLKGAHPEWSPAAIKSAIMTSAYHYDNTGHAISDEATGNTSSSFAYGAGHVDPQGALDPGLVYDAGAYDYINFLCSLNYSASEISLLDREAPACPLTTSPYDLNYPSFSAVFDQSTSAILAAAFTRTVTNVGAPNSTYVASIEAPAGVNITVEPSLLKFSAFGQKKSFKLLVVVRPLNMPPGTLVSAFGYLVWTDGNKHTVQSPIVINWQQSFPSAS